ncbi:MAG: tetratricopeptide repeat protein, partial [Elusimicrobiota bacterium]|nr:tetratricopeptide repeat protein [Elusimicrobiota bacterium]
PFGNIAYRINLMSAFFGALSCGILYLIVKKIAGQNEKIQSSSVYLCGFIAALTLAFSKTFWSVSLVAEMYTLNTFFIVLIIYLLFSDAKASTTLLITFLFGLAMGNRIDIVLITPGILYFLVVAGFNLRNKRNPESSSGQALKVATTILLFFILGFSVYLFLPIRSKTQPHLNWNKPDNIQTLVDTITRKTHGKTLDLISARYTINDVLSSEMKVYLKRTYKLFTYAGIPFMLLGFLYLYGKNKHFLVSTFLIYFISGPVFIAIAKMPPNPHALAIMEPHYLISDLILVIWFGCGIYYISEKLKKLKVLLLIIPVGLFILNFYSQNMRFNFIAYDFARNVFRSIPKNSIIISREDIQVFSQWYLQFAEKKRSDIIVIAKGLSGSKWYQEGLKKYKNTDVISLNNPETFSQFYAINKTRNIYFTGDVEDYEMLGGKYFIYPYWLVFNVKEQKTADYKSVDFENIYIIRNQLKPELYPDFFSQKIVSQYADSLFRCGMFFMREGNIENAIVNFEKSISMKTDTPAAYFNLGWIYFQKNNFGKTEYYYKQSIKFYENMHNEAIEYKSFPEVVDSIIYDWAVVHNNLGTIYEKQNKLNEAISEYEKAVRIKPDYADAHYNMAVAYWRQKNWRKVIENLEKVLRINPNHTNTQKYLFFARKNAGL